MYTITIIGGGAISTGYDSPKDKNILTHIHGSSVHPDIKLDAIVEIDILQQSHIRDKWGEDFELFFNVEEALKKYKSDIVVVATPTSTHLNIIKEIYKIYEPKLILCEKPVVMTINELNELEIIQNNKSTKILTNYIRRFDPSINDMKRFIDTHIDEIHHFYGTFTKGFLHNGSHMIDLIYMLIGDITDIDVLDKKVVDGDIFGKFIIKTDSSLGVISNIDDNNLSLFEFSIYTDEAKIEIRGANQDSYICNIKKSDTFSDYYSFSEEKKLSKTLNKYGYNSLEFAIKIIDNDSLYNIVRLEQNKVNRFILDSKEELIG